MELERNGPAPLARPAPAAGRPRSIAIVIPSFRRGSGGHATIVNIARELTALGHTVEFWLEDCDGRHSSESATVTARSFAEFFAAEGLRLHPDFSDWDGADVAVATGWQTVPRMLLLAGARSRAYLVQDHEPQFYGTSAEALWAEKTYAQGIHCIAASPWLAELLRTRYGASATHFDLAVDHAVYRPQQLARRDDLAVFYARAVTPRRAVPLGMLAFTELAKRRPEIEIALFGEDRELRVPFAHRNLGVLDAPALARLYSEATVGIVLSLTNPSLINLEMMACGLPCIELASESMVATFGRAGAPVLSDLDPLSLCDAIEALLDEPARRARTAAAGLTLAGTRTWNQAAAQVEDTLLRALAPPNAEP
jgi:O-antigen biosynthesis protein